MLNFRKSFLKALDPDGEFARDVAAAMTDVANGQATGAAFVANAPTETMTADSILKNIMELRKLLASQDKLKFSPSERHPSEPASLFGMPIVVSDLLPTTKTVAHKRERKWCHRQRFEKARRFNITYETKDISEVYLLADKVVVNPKQFDMLRTDLPDVRMAPPIGFPDYVPMEPERKHPWLFDTFSIASRSIAKINVGMN